MRSLARGPENVAAVFLEPISGASTAAVVPPDGYLEGVRALCDRYDVLMICDETVTGFGRTGTWWAVDHWDVQPDIVTFAKGVTSGVDALLRAGHQPDGSLTSSPPRRRVSPSATRTRATRSAARSPPR